MLWRCIKQGVKKQAKRIFFPLSLCILGLFCLNFYPFYSPTPQIQNPAGEPADSLFNQYHQSFSYYLKIDSVDLAEQAIKKAIKRARSIEDTSLLILGLKDRAEFDLQRHQFHSSIESGHAIARLAAQANLPLEETTAYRVLRKVFYEIEMVDSAIYYCKKEMELHRLNERYDLLSRSYLDMYAYLRWTLGPTSENTYMLDHLMDSTLGAAIKSKNHFAIATALIEKGISIYHYQYDEGLALINQGLDSARNDPKMINIYYRGLFMKSYALIEFNHFEQAEKNLQECLELIKTGDLPDRQGAVFFQMGRIYHMQGKLKKALTYLNLAYQLEKEQGVTDFQGIYSQLAMVYKKTNQKDSCIYFAWKHINDLYEIFNQNSAKNIAINGARFQMAEHEAQIKDLNHKNEEKELRSRFQKRFIIFLCITVVLILIFILLLNKQFRLTKKAFQSIQEKNARLVQQEQEIASLRKQKREELSERLKETHMYLELLMKREKLFLDPNLSLSSLSEKLKMNKTYLSNLINQSYRCSFIQYIDRYRIKEIIQLIEEKKHLIYSIEALSKMVGFKSKSAFYRAFKEQMNTTPSDYINQLPEE